MQVWSILAQSVPCWRSGYENMTGLLFACFEERDLEKASAVFLGGGPIEPHCLLPLVPQQSALCPMQQHTLCQ